MVLMLVLRGAKIRLVGVYSMKIKELVQTDQKFKDTYERHAQHYVGGRDVRVQFCMCASFNQD